jgi:benzoate/toluate 1,2-dioxygenase alpha subunit/2,4,5-trichlorophenoxyacetic acid oxygenase 1
MSTTFLSEQPRAADAAPSNLAGLLDDRPADGVFSVHRDAFLDRQVFVLEMSRVFENTWVYVGHECQAPKPHDYFTTTIGRQPVIVTRDAAGQLHCVLNSCRHRGMLLCPERAGNQKFHTCRYHGWTYDSSGSNRQVAAQDSGRYPPNFRAEDHGLVQVAQFASHNGFLFASLNAAVPTLAEHLGEAAQFLDLLTLQGPQGLEFVPGSVAYTFEGNWKLQIENALDMYHFGYVHLSYVDLLRRRTQVTTGGLPPTPNGEQGSFSFGRGHALMWRSNSRAAPQLLARRAGEFEARMTPTQLRWSTYGRNLTIFPNLQIVDNVTSMMLRVIHPLQADRTEMRTHCLAPRGEDAAARAGRIRDYEDFFNPSGLATPDDNIIYEHSQTGFAARAAGWTAGYLRGMDRSGLPPTSPHAEELGLKNTEWIVGPRSLGDETCFHDAYREWARLLASAPAPAAGACAINHPKEPS